MLVHVLYESGDIAEKKKHNSQTRVVYFFQQVSGLCISSDTFITRMCHKKKAFIRINFTSFMQQLKKLIVKKENKNPLIAVNVQQNIR